MTVKEMATAGKAVAKGLVTAAEEMVAVGVAAASTDVAAAAMAAVAMAAAICKAHSRRSSSMYTSSTMMPMRHPGTSHDMDHEVELEAAEAEVT